jgi:hypothetical protein
MSWLRLHFIDLELWLMLSIRDWLKLMTKRKDFDSITLLISWELWIERNDWVFKNKHAPPTVILESIQCESKHWFWREPKA